MFNSENFIAVDWGSSNLRMSVYQHSECVFNYTSTAGVMHLQPHQFANIWSQLYQCIPVPLVTDTVVIMSGMIGSNIGWVNTPYLSCPIDLVAVAHHLTPVKSATGLPVFIVPGLKIINSRHTDVLRGEETQLLGVINEFSDYYVFPGTHSKWVIVKDRQVLDFNTVMTGELFQLLNQYSVLANNNVPQEKNQNAFVSGVEKGSLEDCLSHSIFEIRAGTLCQTLAAEHLYEYLSGLLIGYEVAQMKKNILCESNQTLTVVGNAELLRRYQLAFALHKLSCCVVSEDNAFIDGIRRILNENQ